MCEESIFYYLKEKLNDKIEEKILNDFVCKNKFSIEKNKSIITHANLIDELLKNIKICDPAIGSGAFTVSMMNLIVRLRTLI